MRHPRSPESLGTRFNLPSNNEIRFEFHPWVLMGEEDKCSLETSVCVVEYPFRVFLSRATDYLQQRRKILRQRYWRCNRDHCTRLVSVGCAEEVEGRFACRLIRHPRQFSLQITGGVCSARAGDDPKKEKSHAEKRYHNKTPKLGCMTVAKFNT